MSSLCRSTAHQTGFQACGLPTWLHSLSLPLPNAGSNSFTTLGGVLPTSSDLSNCQLVAHTDSKLAVACLEASATQPVVLLFDGSKWMATPTAGLPAQATLPRLAATPSGTLFVAFSDTGAGGAVGADQYSVTL